MEENKDRLNEMENNEKKYNYRNAWYVISDAKEDDIIPNEYDAEIWRKLGRCKADDIALSATPDNHQTGYYGCISVNYGEYYIAVYAGGFNGGGPKDKWSLYFNEIDDIMKKLGDSWLVELHNDCCDDVWYLTVAFRCEDGSVEPREPLSEEEQMNIVFRDDNTVEDEFVVETRRSSNEVDIQLDDKSLKEYVDAVVERKIEKLLCNIDEYLDSEYRTDIAKMFDIRIKEEIDKAMDTATHKLVEYLGDKYMKVIQDEIDGRLIKSLMNLHNCSI